MRKRMGVMAVVVLGGVLAVATLASYGVAGSAKSKEGTSNRMTGYQEVPSVSSLHAKGTIELSIHGSTIDYRLSYSGLSSSAVAAHIHFGQRDVNGGVSAFLCSGGDKPACPASGTVTGTIDAADVIGPAGQGIAAGEIGELIAAIKAGVTYANVHTSIFPGGEIRGQIKAKHDDD
ncbi:MAG: CHRD domain-containing protein [Actinobacteria bacterium]|nr:CHRD domain-containing protein [Actinomycetota bacterium]